MHKIGKHNREYQEELYFIGIINKDLSKAIHFNVGHDRWEETASKRTQGQGLGSRGGSPKSLKQEGT